MSKQKNQRHTTSANRYGRNLRVMQKALALILVTSFVFSGCKKSMENAGSPADSPMADQGSGLKTNVVPGPDFMIAVLPDTQYYVEGAGGTYIPPAGTASLQMLLDQTKWIADHKVDSNIVYVAQLGDVTDNGDHSSVQYPHAAQGLYKLDTAGIAYGAAVGNHDMQPNGSHEDENPGPLTSTTDQYNQYFGIAHFTGKTYYGGHYGTTNNNHYDYFSAGGLNFMALYIEYDQFNQRWSTIENWANGLITANADKKVFVVMHYVGGPTTPSNFGDQCAHLYGAIKNHGNLFMFLGGHVYDGTTHIGEGYRQDTYNGRTKKSFISDYQDYVETNGVHNGGNGFMRLMKFSVAKDLITIKTISPFIQNHPTLPNKPPYEETDANSKFTKALFHEETTTRKCDFNKDGKTELSFFNAGTWKINGMSNFTYGASGDIPVPMDYDGDGDSDWATYRPSTGMWYSYYTANHTWGTSTDIPVPADYDGDGMAEFAYFRPSTGYWYIYPTTTGINYGNPGDIPVPGDYDGDGAVDIAIYRPSDFTWHLRNISVITWGAAGDIPVSGDYNGDGKTDVVLFRPSSGIWYINGQTNVPAIVAHAAGDIPAPGDYDGQGKTQPAVYRPSTHTLYIYHWVDGSVTTVNYAASASGDKLLNLPYHIRKFFFP